MNNPFMPNAMPQTPANTAPIPGAPAANPNMSFSVDLTDVRDDLSIPDGAYKARCIEVEQSVSQSGNPMFVWTFVLVGGQYDGREFKSWTAITPAAMWKVAETVIALGVGQSGQVVEFKRGDVVGKECGVVMEASEYNGRMSSKISRVISLAELAQVQQAGTPTMPGM